MGEELIRLPCCLRTGIPMFVAFSFSSGYKRFSMENKPYPRFYSCPHRHCTNIQFMERKEIQSFSIYW